MTLTDLIAALRASFVIVLLAVVVAAAATVGIGLSLGGGWTAEASVAIGPAVGLVEEDALVQSAQVLNNRAVANTVAETAASDVVLAAAATAVDLDAVADDYVVTARVAPEANVVTIAVAGSDPEVAEALAGAIRTQATAVFEDLYPIYRLAPLDGPTAEEDEGPGLPLLLAAGVVLGLGLGVAVALVRAHLRAAAHAGATAMAGPGSTTNGNGNGNGYGRPTGQLQERKRSAPRQPAGPR